MDKQKKEARQKTSRTPVVAAIICAILGLAACSVVAIGVYHFTHTNHNNVTSRNAVENDGNKATTSTENSISKVAEQVSPSVVSIITSVATRSIFGASQQQAAGTGIVVSKDGYVLTNYHVVDGASAVHVVLNDGTAYDDVTVVGRDPLNDVAYLKINNASDLTAVTFGDSSTIRVGQQVVAIGNALGQYQNTVSSGIISGKGRPIAASSEDGDSSESLTDLLQTDAAINPGNSGGPLLNFSGQVIGMNTAVASEAEGIGFAIPINAVKGTLKSVLAGKGVQRSYIGLRYVGITAALAKEYSLPVKVGAYVVGGDGEAAVVSGGPADRAGLKNKDILTKINGETIGEAGSVSTLIGEYAPGDTVEVTYLRGKTEHTVKVTLDAYRNQ